MSAATQPYARAFLETAAAGYDVARFLEGAAAVAAAIERNPTLRAFLSAPAVPEEAKKKALAEIAARAGLDPLGQRFFQVLLKNHRVLESGEIVQAVREAQDARLGLVQGRVVVAAPIDDEERKRIERALAARVGKTVRVRVDVDPGILAGFVARVGSNVFDASAASAIRRFRENTNDGKGV
jgi:F-type H+-transporting ATPase subunit delta